MLANTKQVRNIVRNNNLLFNISACYTDCTSKRNAKMRSVVYKTFANVAELQQQAQILRKLISNKITVTGTERYTYLRIKAEIA
jgi:hypothetical protein